MFDTSQGALCNALSVKLFTGGGNLELPTNMSDETPVLRYFTTSQYSCTEVYNLKKGDQLNASISLSSSTKHHRLSVKIRIQIFQFKIWASGFTN